MAQPAPPRKPRNDASAGHWMTAGPAQLRRQLRRAMRLIRSEGPNQIQFWLLALLIGIGAGLAALLFRLGINALQYAAYGIDDLTLTSDAGLLPWWWLIAVPTLGGLVVGLILNRFTPDGRVRTVADVIEGAALEGGRVERARGWHLPPPR